MENFRHQVYDFVRLTWFSPQFHVTFTYSLSHSCNMSKVYFSFWFAKLRSSFEVHCMKNHASTVVAVCWNKVQFHFTFNFYSCDQRTLKQPTTSELNLLRQFCMMDDVSLSDFFLLHFEFKLLEFFQRWVTHLYLQKKYR